MNSYKHQKDNDTTHTHNTLSDQPSRNLKWINTTTATTTKIK